MEDMKGYTNLHLLQKENFELKSQLETKQKLHEDNSELISQLQKELKDYYRSSRHSQVKTKLIKELEELKVHNKIIQEEKSALKSQLDVKQKELEDLRVKKSRELKEV